MPTKQETFDTVLAHARKQKCRAYGKLPDDPDLGERCLYRDQQGRKCFAGCLIPDELYDPSMEGGSVMVGNGQRAITQAGKVIESLGHDLHLVRELQLIHDSYRVPEWERKFQDVAVAHCLLYMNPTK